MKKMILAFFAAALLVLMPNTAHAADEPVTDDVTEVLELLEEEAVVDLMPEETPAEEELDVPVSEEILVVDEPSEEEGEVVDPFVPRPMGDDEAIWLDGDFEGCFQQSDMIICPEQPVAEEPANVVNEVSSTGFTSAPAPAAPTAQPAMLAETGMAEFGQAIFAIAAALVAFGGWLMLSTKRRLRKQKAD